MDIPGFLYDPIKKKYFRITAGTTGSVFLTEGNAKVRHQQLKTLNRDNEERKTRTTIPPNFIKRLTLQEQGTPCNVSDLGSHFVQGRIKTMDSSLRIKINTTDVQGNEMTDPSCSHLCVKPEEGSVYGSWTCSSGTCVMARIPLSKASTRDDSETKSITPEILECFPPGSKIMDMDSVLNEDQSFTLCLSFFPLRRREVVHLDNEYASSLSLQSWTNTDYPDMVDQEMGTKMNFQFPGVYSSCCGSRSRFAIGGRNHIKMLTSSSTDRNTRFDGFLNYKSFVASSRVTCLSFDNTLEPDARSIELFAGTNKGIIHIYDIDNAKEVVKKRILRKTISNLLQVNENRWIVSGHDDQLIMLDRRYLDGTVVTFNGHRNSCHTFPLTLDQEFRILCSSGDDSITRTWSLDSGKLLNETPLPADMVPSTDNFVQSVICRIPSAAGRPTMPNILSVRGLDLMIHRWNDVPD